MKPFDSPAIVAQAFFFSSINHHQSSSDDNCHRWPSLAFPMDHRSLSQFRVSSLTIRGYAHRPLRTFADTNSYSLVVLLCVQILLVVNIFLDVPYL